MRRTPVIALLVLGAGCASAATPPSTRPSLLATYRRAPPYASPAHWRYHPRRPAAMFARERLGTGWVLAGERGERWLVAGSAEASPHLAPESLLHILRPDPDRWMFVGASGTAYEARDPLGPFLRSAAPLDPLVRVSAAGSTLLGLRADGALVRSADGGISWNAAGPADGRIADVSLLADGSGLALSVPERWWITRDYAASWQPAQYAPLGALGLYQDQQASIVVEGVLGYARLARGTSGGLVTLGGAAPERQTFQVGVRLRRGPDAGALSEGRAIIAGGRYVEVARERDPGSSWQLWQGSVEGFLRPALLPAVTGCQALRLGGFHRWLVLACWHQAPTDSAETVDLFASDDGGKSWRPAPVTMWARYSEFELAVGANGSVLVSGVCASAEAQRGCRPRGVHYLGPVTSRRGSQPTARRELVPAVTPAASGTASALGFSADGSIAYAAAPRKQGRAYALYVSRDQGKSFVARELGALGPGKPGSDDDESPSYSRRRAAPALSVEAADDGSVAVLVRSGDELKLWVTDDEGRVITTSAAPPGSNGLGAVGARALAFSTGSGDAWESLDGGASWDDIGRLPLPLCRGDPGCRLPVACHSAGCVIGDELSRIGWHGQAETARAVLPPPEPRVREGGDRKVAVPFACTLAPDAWKHVDGAELMPRAEQAALGKLVWFAPSTHESSGSFGVVHGIGGPRAHLERVTLLPAVADRRARYLSLQVEGVAALRYRVATPKDPRLTDVEVGWENLVEGRVRFARLPDGGPYRPGDYESGPVGWQTARPHLLSIATGGIYLRLHASAGDAQTTWFMDGRTVVGVPPVAWPRPNGGTPRTEMVHVDGQHVPLMFVGNGTALVRARWQNPGWAFEAFATGLAQPKKFGLVQAQDIGYLGERAGLEISQYDAAETEHHAWLFPFRATGALLDPPVELPTQLAAGPRPRACAAAERASTPRVVMPFQAGTRHPVVVSDGNNPQRVLITSAAVMHGTPREPCLDALEANQVEPASGTEAGLETAILPLDDLDHAWLFRLVAADPKSTPGFDYRLMSCRFDPTLEVPGVVYEAPGTLVPRR